MLKKENWTVTWKSAGITAGLFALTTVVCALLQRLGLNEISQLRNETYVPLVYVLCVLLVSLLTDGYLCGTVVSLLSVFAVNYVFTYPYMHFNFSLSGYPLTFFTMFAVSLTVNTLTATLKRQERIRMEAETERMRANLLRAISHDLRTPLTAISGSAITLLENDNLPDWQKKKLLGSINDDAEWLIRMVENLLSVTRIGLESARIEKQDEVAEEVIFSAISKFRAHFPGVAVTPQLPESVMLVPMDPVLIQQVLTNLLENSARHGGATEITVSLARQGNVAVFTVQDNGTGIVREKLPHLFDGIGFLPEKNGVGGRSQMGIGLSVCMSIVKAHGGSMSARNTDGGTAVSFSLPVPPESETAAEQRNIIRTLKPAKETAMETKDKILIVEDDETIAAFLIAVLEANGFDTIRASLGREAVTLISSHCPDLVLLDLSLPDMDGMEILAGLRKWSTLPVIVVSARGRERDKVIALDMGADDYLTKPFGPGELLARIRAALRHVRTAAGGEVGRTGVYRCGDLEVDCVRRRVRINGEDIHLTQSEYRILSLLTRHAGKVLTYDFILRELWGPSAGGSNQILRVNVANIRRKIEKNPAEPKYIFTEIGVGYRMTDADATDEPEQ